MAHSPEGEIFQGGSTGQENIERGRVCGLQGLGGSLDHHGSSQPQPEKGGVPWWSSDQENTSYPPHRSPRPPGVSLSSHSYTLQAVLWGALACLVNPTLEVHLYQVPLRSSDSFSSSHLSAGAA